MISPVTSITRKSIRRPEEPLNIVDFCTHERAQVALSKTNHQFYAWRCLDGSIKDWDETYAKVPNNYTLLNPDFGNEQLPNWIDFDLVLSQNKFGQYKIAQQIAKQLQLPLITVEHTLPHPTWNVNQIKSLTSMKGCVNVFISEFSRKEWYGEGEDSRVIHHGIDTDLFSPNLKNERKRVLLSVVNDWINRDWCVGFNLWRSITKDLPVLPVGKTPGLSLPAKDINDLVNFYSTSQIFLNTSLISPVPTALLEAMSCGCAVVSTATCMIPEIIKNGYNGYMSNNPQELRNYLLMLLDNPAKCQELGNNARKTILDNFPMEKFVREWDTLFHSVANKNWGNE